MRGAEEDWLLQGDDKQKDWEPSKSPIAMEVDEKEVCENQTAGRRGGRGRTAGRNKGQRNPPKLTRRQEGMGDKIEAARPAGAVEEKEEGAEESGMG